MIDISLNNLNKYYGSNHVLKGITFEINSGEKVGLLGKNGSGKTTLFKVISGSVFYESGNFSKASGKKIELLEQIPVFQATDTSEDVLRSSFTEINEILKAMKAIEGDVNPAVLKRYGHLMEEYERLGGYEIEFRLDKICAGMHIDSRLRSSLFSQLSGGEKSRINLAKNLLRECDILLLDEPTNHLDLASLEWLEKFLREFKGTVIVISHDRVFLDQVIDRIIEIENGEAHFYSGNYSFYIEEKHRRFIYQSEQYERQQKEIKRIEERAKWFVEQERFTTKHKAILSRIDHMEKIEKPQTTKKLTSEFDSGAYASKEILSFHSVQKCYGCNTLFADVDLSIIRNDRIALIGENGSGKTTLMKIIMGEEATSSGEVTISPSVKYGYMPQIIEFNDEKATVLELFRTETGITEEKARSILFNFLFVRDDVYKTADKLSGGERSRLKLCLLMQKNTNFLLLDEPTNHLDIASREWIENALMAFDGTIVFVSHDRYFLKKFADKIWSLENSSVIPYDCSFNEYLDLHRTQNEPTVKKDKAKKPTANRITQSVKVKQPSFSIEELIEAAEAELKLVESEIEAEIEIGNFSKMNDLDDRKNQILEKINLLYDDWAAGEK